MMPVATMEGRQMGRMMSQRVRIRLMPSSPAISMRDLGMERMV